MTPPALEPPSSACASGCGCVVLLAAVLLVADVSPEAAVVLAVVGLVIFGISQKNGHGHARSSADRRQSQAAAKAHRLIGKHVSALSTRRRQLVQVDPYGRSLTEQWENEKHYFIENVLAAELGEGPLAPELFAKLLRVIDTRVAQYDKKILKKGMPADATVDGFSGVAFEHMCADLLRNNGWTVRVTEASGDQGGDLVADKGAYKVVIQCKRYSRPVGNKAVQEVLAARQYYDATHAAVVANRGFTQSAQRLAGKSSVMLLHFQELPELYSVLTRLGTPLLGFDSH